MHFILKSISFIFHPIFMPLIGVVFYFSKSPRFLPKELIYSKLISLGILSVILPVLAFYLLKTLGKAKTIYLQSSKERILPLIINSFILIVIIFRVFPASQLIELHFFFIAVLMSTLSCLILAILSFKASIHLIAVTGVFSFFVLLSINYSININGTLAFMCVLIGAISTSRLYLKAHTVLELFVGSVLGIFPQIIMINYWF